MTPSEIRRIVDTAKAKGLLKPAPLVKRKVYAARKPKNVRFGTWPSDKMTVLMQEARRPIT